MFQETYPISSIFPVINSKFSTLSTRSATHTHTHSRGVETCCLAPVYFLDALLGLCTRKDLFFLGSSKEHNFSGCPTFFPSLSPLPLPNSISFGSELKRYSRKWSKKKKIRTLYPCALYCSKEESPPPPHSSSYVSALLLNIQRKLNVSWCVHFFFGVFSSQGSCSENAGAGASARGEGAPPPLPTTTNSWQLVSAREKKKQVRPHSHHRSSVSLLYFLAAFGCVCVCV